MHCRPKNRWKLKELINPSVLPNSLPETWERRFKMPPIDRLRPSVNGAPIGEHVRDSIRETGEMLLSRYKNLAAAWGKAEDRLLLVHAPSEASIIVGEETIEASDGAPLAYETQSLSYCRWRGKWRICYEVHTQLASWTGPGDGTEDDCKPIVDAPVDVRLAMFDRFNDLEAAVVDAAKSYVPKIDEAVAAFERSLNC
jgi:hypothetical protein